MHNTTAVMSDCPKCGRNTRHTIYSVFWGKHLSKDHFTTENAVAFAHCDSCRTPRVLRIPDNLIRP